MQVLGVLTIDVDHSHELGIVSFNFLITIKFCFINLEGLKKINSIDSFVIYFP